MQNEEGVAWQGVVFIVIVTLCLLSGPVGIIVGGLLKNA
jgi:hypothetical protein